MKYIIFLFLALASAAQSATVYQNQVVPISSKPCMIELQDGNIINGNFVREVWISNFERYTKQPSFFKPVEREVYTALRITLITNVTYEYETGDLGSIKQQFMKKLQNCGN
jgi:hypothetical protein